MDREDLIAELEAIAADASAGLERIASGEAVNGVGTLTRVRDRAGDVVRHARTPTQEPHHATQT